MTHSIDASFKLRKQVLAARRRRARWRKVLVSVGVLALLSVAAAIYLTADYWAFGDYDEELEVSEGADEVPADASVYVPAIVDLPGDPMWINLSGGDGAETKRRSMARPADLAESGLPPQIEVLSDTMLSSSERFMTTIPSTQEDFAFFQAQRTTVASPSGSLQIDLKPSLSMDAPPQVDAREAGALSDQAAGWGETIDAGEADLPEFQKTEVENNTSVATVTSESDRFETTEDIFVKILTDRTLDSVVIEGNFSAEEARLAGEALKTLFKLDGLASTQRVSGWISSVLSASGMNSPGEIQPRSAWCQRSRASAPTTLRSSRPSLG